jgi:hypothetical protein
MQGWVEAGGIPHPTAWAWTIKATRIKPMIPPINKTFFAVSSKPRTFISGGYHRLPE